MGTLSLHNGFVSAARKGVAPAFMHLRVPWLQPAAERLDFAGERGLHASTSFWPAQTSRTDVEAGAMPRIMARERKDDAPRHVDGEMD